jgi:hypothetical protein
MVTAVVTMSNASIKIKKIRGSKGLFTDDPAGQLALKSHLVG